MAGVTAGDAGEARAAPQVEVDGTLWNAAAQGGKTTTTGRRSYDKSPEAPARRAAVWTDRSWLDRDQAETDFRTDEERRIRSWGTREPLRRTVPLREHKVIDGEYVETHDPVADLPPHVVEARDQLAEWARHRVDWPPIVAAWEQRHRDAQAAAGLVATMPVVFPAGLADPAVRLYLGLPALPFDDELGRWEDDGGR